ncbi:MAG: hypothetical protein JF617_04290 [Burkholderiales bacterium]|nr:hypothetical protein [Burkholderiales bacterium]
MTSNREHIVRWVAEQVMPHEAGVRAWLRRARVPADEIDDLMQEAYAKLVGLQQVDQIESPDGYFFQVVRNLLTDKLRRAKVVRIEAVTEIEALSVCSDEPSPEQATASRRELGMRLIMRALEEEGADMRGDRMRKTNDRSRKG